MSRKKSTPYICSGPAWHDRDPSLVGKSKRGADVVDATRSYDHAGHSTLGPEITSGVDQCVTIGDDRTGRDHGGEVSYHRF